jgi:hypothetical protein
MELKASDSSHHFVYSVIKSALRGAACVVLIVAQVDGLTVGASLLLAAEVLGVLEEI